MSDVSWTSDKVYLQIGSTQKLAKVKSERITYNFEAEARETVALIRPSFILGKIE